MTALAAASPESTALRVRGLCRAYDDHYGLIDLAADLPSGVVTAVLGPNGSGKSTLIGLLATLLRPTEGVIYLGDEVVTSRSPDLRSAIGYVGHRTMLYAALSARENLRFFGRLYAAPDREARIDQLLRRVGLAEEAPMRPEVAPEAQEPTPAEEPEAEVGEAQEPAEAEPEADEETKEGE